MKKITGWNSFADVWHLLDKPIRPRGETFKIYEKFIRGVKKHNNALILGATPELRELTGKFFRQTVFVDISLEMILKTEKLVSPQYKNQIMVRGDWLKIPLPEHYFDVVLADVSTSSLSFNQYRNLFFRIYQFLRKEGAFISRQWIYIERNQNFFEEYLKKRQLNNISEFLLVIEEFLARKNYLSPAADVYTTFKHYQDQIKKLKPKRNYKFLCALMPLFKNNPMVWSISPKEKVEQRFKEFFKIVKIDFAQDHYLKDSLPIYFLKKKTGF
jgi:ubiquinone/menaquinone biosynthesis C-methylase UbiE